MARARSKAYLSLCVIIWNNVVGVTKLKQDPDGREREKWQPMPFMRDRVSPALSGDCTCKF